MNEVKDDIRLQRKTKEEMLAMKQKKIKEKAYKANKINRVNKNLPKEKLQADQKTRIIVLNIIQIVILAAAVLVEVLAVNGYIPQFFTIIGLVVLTVSCILIIKKINKTIS